MSATNSFGTFLQTKNLLRGRPVRVGGLERIGLDPGTGGGAFDQVQCGMGLLKATEFPVRFEGLRESSELPQDELLQAVDWLKRAKLIEGRVEGDDEVLSLTDAGSNVVGT
jgi:hypothetical protein